MCDAFERAIISRIWSVVCLPAGTLDGQMARQERESGKELDGMGKHEKLCQIQCCIEELHRTRGYNNNNNKNIHKMQ